MLFKIVKITNGNEKEDSLKVLSETNEINPVFDDKKELLYLNYNTDFELKVIPLFFNESLFFLLNTFEKSKIDNFKIWFEGITDSPLSEITFTNDSFKGMINGNGKIVELTAIIHDYVTDEISISGSDLKSSEFYTSIIEKGEIKKIVLYLDEPDENLKALLKIFYDGRISIIPELEFKQIKSLITYVLKRLKIE